MALTEIMPVPVLVLAIGFIVLFIACWVIWIVKELEFKKELKRRLPDVAYTEIVSSSNGSNGTVSTLNSNGGVGFGSYRSRPTTKFLVVYTSGYKQIVTIEDGTALFKEYVARLRND